MSLSCAFVVGLLSIIWGAFLLYIIISDKGEDN